MSAKSHNRTNTSNESPICVSLNQSWHDLHTISGTNFNNILAFNEICVLDLSHNYLKSLPDELVQLTMLETLNVSNNSINGVDNIAWPQIKVLTTLDLSFNEIENFPKTLVESRNLKCLNLSQNSIQTIPANIKQIKSLEQLYLKFNKIQSLPDDFFQLTNLKILDLGYNKLKNISCKIVQCNRLAKLDLSYNMISELPKDIIHLYQLSKLNVDFNPITIPPMNVCALGMMHIFKYFAKLNATSTSSDQQPASVTIRAINMAKYIYQKSSSTPTSNKLHRYAIMGGVNDFDSKLFEKFQGWKNESDAHEMDATKDLYESHTALCHNATKAINNTIGKKLKEENIINLLLDGNIVNKFLSQISQSASGEPQLTRFTDVSHLQVYMPLISERWGKFLKHSQDLLNEKCPFTGDDVLAISKNPLNHIDIILDTIILLYNK